MYQKINYFLFRLSSVGISRDKFYLANIVLGLVLLMSFGCGKEKVPDTSKEAELLLNQVVQTPKDASDYPQLIDSLFSLSSRQGYKKGMAKALSLKGNYFYSRRQFEQALEKYLDAAPLNEQAADLLELGDTYYNIGSSYFDLRRREDALIALKRSIDIRTQSNDSVGLGSSYNFTGYVYWLFSNYDSAVYYFEKSLEIRNKLPNVAHRATTYNNLGTVFYNWSLYDKALAYYLRSLELQKEQSNSSGIARCLSNIGLVYKETAQNEKAIEYYRESLQYAIASGIIPTIGYVYNCLGTAFSSVNRDSALLYLKKSLDTYQSGNDTVGLALALQGLGNYYLDGKDWQNAKIYFTKMLNLAIRENIPMRIARAYKGLGQTFLMANKLSEAQDSFEKCIVIGEKAAIKFILRDAHSNLAEIYERQGENDKAFSALKQFNKYNQLIENEGMQKRLLDLKNKSEYEKYQRNLQNQKYENEKQQIYLIVTIIALLFLLAVAIVLSRLNNRTKKVNLLLKEKNFLIEGQSKEISLKNVELVELNEAKEKLFSIIGHDLRSPFNTLINLGTIIKEDYYDLTDEQRLDYISALEETTVKTYELVENLLNLSASRTGRINFEPEQLQVSLVVDKIFNLSKHQAGKKNVRLLNNVEPTATAYADKAMLAIILRNLVSNAIKFSNAEGRIEISSQVTDQNLLIFVQDYGTGIDDTIKDNIFNINMIHSKRGTAGEKGTGLGLGLCKEFVEKHGGTIWVESELGKGSKFVFSIPLEKPEVKFN